MSTITFELTDLEATAVDAGNGGAYPSPSMFVAALIRARVPEWQAQLTKVTDAKILAAFAEASDTRTKADILADAKIPAGSVTGTPQ